MSGDWDDYAKDWDQNAAARSYADQAFKSLVEHVDVRRPSWKRRRVLDFGCGTGLFTVKLALFVRDVIAIDTSPAMVDMLQQKEIDNVTSTCVDTDDPAVRSAP